MQLLQPTRRPPAKTSPTTFDPLPGLDRGSGTCPAPLYILLDRRDWARLKVAVRAMRIQAAPACGEAGPIRLSGARRGGGSVESLFARADA